MLILITCQLYTVTALLSAFWIFIIILALFIYSFIFFYFFFLHPCLRDTEFLLCDCKQVVDDRSISGCFMNINSSFFAEMEPEMLIMPFSSSSSSSPCTQEDSKSKVRQPSLIACRKIDAGFSDNIFLFFFLSLME